jgi:hypothetical protein
MTSGVRYSLILFFDPDSVEDQFHTRVAGIKNGRVRRLMAEFFFPSAESSQGVLALSRLLGSGGLTVSRKSMSLTESGERLSEVQSRVLRESMSH